MICNSGVWIDLVKQNDCSHGWQCTVTRHTTPCATHFCEIFTGHIGLCAPLAVMSQLKFGSRYPQKSKFWHALCATCALLGRCHRSQAILRTSCWLSQGRCLVHCHPWLQQVGRTFKKVYLPHVKLNVQITNYVTMDLIDEYNHARMTSECLDPEGEEWSSGLFQTCLSKPLYNIQPMEGHPESRNMKPGDA